ncbi:MAG: TonB family protein [Terracidiphilus sp.]
MNSSVLSIVSYALNAAWQIPLLAVVGWVASRLLRRWGPHAQHRVWVATLLLSILTPALVTQPAMVRSFVTVRQSVLDGSSLMAISVSDGDTLRRGATFVLPPWLIWFLFALYLGSLLYFAARLLWLLAAAHRLVRSATPQSFAPAATALWRQARQAFAPADVSVLSSTGVQGALTIGALKPSIVLPAGFVAQSAEQEIVSALGHEMAHVERHDYAKNLFYEIAGILVAFHPVAWIVKKQIVETREMICDALVVMRLVDTKTYRQSLLRLAQRMISAQPATVHAVGIFDGNILEKRIMSLKTKRNVPGSLARAGLAGCAVILLATAMVGVSALARPVETPQAYQDAPGTVYKIGGDVSAPVVIHSVEARFSDKARRAKYQGVCLISLVVDAQGNPQNVHVARALGMGLDKNAVEAVRQYKFKPALKNGRTPVPVAITIEVDFRLY